MKKVSKKPAKKPAKKKSPAITKPLLSTVKILPPRKGPPPPPPRKGPPPLVHGRGQPQFAAVVAAERAALPMVKHRPILAGASHLEFTTKDGRTVVVAPVKCWGDFSTSPGIIRYGTLVGIDQFRYAPGEAPVQPAAPAVASTGRKGPPPLPGQAARTPAAPKAPRSPASGKREGVCAWLDNLIMESDGKRSVSEILALALAQFPGRDPASTINTIRTRPSMMRIKGLNPKPYRKE